jgi:hypothetical protein
MTIAVGCIVGAVLIALMMWHSSVNNRKLDELERLADLSQLLLVDYPRLQKGWDGYRAEPICAASLEKARKVFARMRVYGCGDWWVSPGADGSVQYTLKGKDGAWFQVDMYDDCYMLWSNRPVRGMDVHGRGGFKTQDVGQVWEWMRTAAVQYGEHKPVKVRKVPDDFDKFEQEGNAVFLVEFGED